MKQTAEFKKKKSHRTLWVTLPAVSIEPEKTEELKERGFGFGVTLHNMNGGMLHVIIWNINTIVHTNSPLHFGNLKKKKFFGIHVE